MFERDAEQCDMERHSAVESGNDPGTDVQASVDRAWHGGLGPMPKDLE